MLVPCGMTRLSSVTGHGMWIVKALDQEVEALEQKVEALDQEVEAMHQEALNQEVEALDQKVKVLMVIVGLVVMKGVVSRKRSGVAKVLKWMGCTFLLKNIEEMPCLVGVTAGVSIERLEL